jgi:lipid A ethanolaminephosphotransferase
MGIDTGCLAKDADQPRSHDNLFHTVLGMMDVQTKVYNRDLDAFAACTRPDSRETTPAYHAAQNLEPAAPAEEPPRLRLWPDLL